MPTDQLNDTLFQRGEASIAAITAKNKQTFDSWVKVPGHKQSLDIPDDALKYVFIPDKIFAEAQNPEKIDVLVIYRNKLGLRFLILEHMDKPVSSAENFEAYHQAIVQVDNQSIADQEAGLPLQPSSYPEKPANVDYFHAKPFITDLIADKTLSLNDYIFAEFSISLSSVEHYLDCFIVGNYEDRPELRGK